MNGSQQNAKPDIFAAFVNIQQVFFVITLSFLKFTLTFSTEHDPVAVYNCKVIILFEDYYTSLDTLQCSFILPGAS